jgi:hypothetical protein
MKMMKRFFKKRRRRQSAELEGEPDVPKPTESNITTANIYSGFKIPPPADEPSKDHVEDESVYKIEKIAVKKVDGKLLRYSPKTVLKQPSKKEVPDTALAPALSSEPAGKTKDIEIDSAHGVPEKGGNLLKSIDDDKSIASSTKSGSDGEEKKVKSNGDATPSPVKDKVNEVVVPRSGAEDRHATISNAYDSIPLLEQTKLPRGGISVETKAVGRVQVRIASYLCKRLSSSLSCFQIVAFLSHSTIAMITNSDGCYFFVSLSTVFHQKPSKIA